MNNAEKLISLYHRGSLVCLVLAVLFLSVTVVLFFRFHIRALMTARSGWSRKQGIREIEAGNERTGRLPGAAGNTPDRGRPGPFHRGKEKCAEASRQDLAGAAPEQTGNKGEEKEPCAKDETESWPGC